MPINNITLCSVPPASAVHKFHFYTVTNRTPKAGDNQNVCTFRHAFISTQLKCRYVTLSEQSALNISGAIRRQGNCSSSSSSSHFGVYLAPPHFTGLDLYACSVRTPTICTPVLSADQQFVRLFCPHTNNLYSCFVRTPTTSVPNAKDTACGLERWGTQGAPHRGQTGGPTPSGCYNEYACRVQ